MLSDYLQLYSLPLDLCPMQGLNCGLGPLGVFKGGFGLTCRSVLFVPEDLAGVKVAIRGEEVLQVILCDVIVKVLDKDGSAALCEAFEPPRLLGRAPESLLGFHERLPLEPATSVTMIAASAPASLVVLSPVIT